MKRFLFLHGSAAGDPDWKEVSGNWSVNSSQRFVSARLKNNRAIVQGIAALNPFSTGRLATDLKLTRKFVTIASGAVIFAYRDKSNYRYVRMKKGTKSKVVIGQVGDPA